MFTGMLCLTKAKWILKGGGRYVSVSCQNPARHLSTGFSKARDANPGGEPNVNESQLYDVIISGGGMVGTAMACSLGE